MVGSYRHKKGLLQLQSLFHFCSSEYNTEMHFPNLLFAISPIHMKSRLFYTRRHSISNFVSRFVSFSLFLNFSHSNTFHVFFFWRWYFQIGTVICYLYRTACVHNTFMMLLSYRKCIQICNDYA